MKAISGALAVVGATVAGFIAGKIADANASPTDLKLGAAVGMLGGTLLGAAGGALALTSKAYRPAGTAALLTSGALLAGEKVLDATGVLSKLV